MPILVIFAWYDKEVENVNYSDRDGGWKEHLQAVRDYQFCLNLIVLLICVKDLVHGKNAKTPIRTPGVVPRIYGRKVCGENQSRVLKYRVTWPEARGNST